jgi:hypothetical protein
MTEEQFNEYKKDCPYYADSMTQACKILSCATEGYIECSMSVCGFAYFHKMKKPKVKTKIVRIYIEGDDRPMEIHEIPEDQYSVKLSKGYLGPLTIGVEFKL